MATPFMPTDHAAASEPVVALRAPIQTCGHRPRDLDRLTPTCERQVFIAIRPRRKLWQLRRNRPPRRPLHLQRRRLRPPRRPPRQPRRLQHPPRRPLLLPRRRPPPRRLLRLPTRLHLPTRRQIPPRRPLDLPRRPPRQPRRLLLLPRRPPHLPRRLLLRRRLRPLWPRRLRLPRSLLPRRPPRRRRPPSLPLPLWLLLLRRLRPHSTLRLPGLSRPATSPERHVLQRASPTPHGLGLFCGRSRHRPAPAPDQGWKSSW